MPTKKRYLRALDASPREVLKQSGWVDGPVDG
jgi:hypothetical protein